MKKLTINQWAIEDRPREKMMLKGAEALSDAELLAILIGSGNTEESAVTLMQRTLACCNNDLNRLGKWEVHDFSRFKGLGPAKSITIMAALELGKRRKLQEHPEHTVIRSSNDIYEIFHPLLCDLTIEEFWVLLLNQATHVIDKVRISRGGISPNLSPMTLSNIFKLSSITHCRVLPLPDGLICVAIILPFPSSGSCWRLPAGNNSR